MHVTLSTTDDGRLCKSKRWCMFSLGTWLKGTFLHAHVHAFWEKFAILVLYGELSFSSFPLAPLCDFALTKIGGQNPFWWSEISSFLKATLLLQNITERDLDVVEGFLSWKFCFSSSKSFSGLNCSKGKEDRESSLWSLPKKGVFLSFHLKLSFLSTMIT